MSAEINKEDLYSPKIVVNIPLRELEVLIKKFITQEVKDELINGVINDLKGISMDKFEHHVDPEKVSPLTNAVIISLRDKIFSEYTRYDDKFLVYLAEALAKRITDQDLKQALLEFFISHSKR